MYRCVHIVKKAGKAHCLELQSGMPVFLGASFWQEGVLGNRAIVNSVLETGVALPDNSGY